MAVAARRHGGLRGQRGRLQQALLSRSAARRSARRSPVPPGWWGRWRFPNRTSDVLTFAIDTPTSPTDVWQVAVKSGALTRWTRSEVGGMDTSRFVGARAGALPVHRRRDSAGLPLPAARARPGTRRRWWSTGTAAPRRRSRPQFTRCSRRWCELGMAVLLPNVRGSDGYGKAYLAADDGVKREEALKDIGATLDFIGRAAGPGPARVAVYRRQLRRLHDAGLGGLLPRALPGGGGRGGHLQPRHLPEQHRRPTAGTCAAPSTATSGTRRCARCRNASRP